MKGFNTAFADKLNKKWEQRQEFFMQRSKSKTKCWGVVGFVFVLYVSNLKL